MIALFSEFSNSLHWLSRIVFWIVHILNLNIFYNFESFLRIDYVFFRFRLFISFFTALFIFGIFNSLTQSTIYIICNIRFQIFFYECLDIFKFHKKFLCSITTVSERLYITNTVYYWSDTNMMWFTITHIVITSIIKFNRFLDFFR